MPYFEALNNHNFTVLPAIELIFDTTGFLLKFSFQMVANLWGSLKKHEKRWTPYLMVKWAAREVTIVEILKGHSSRTERGIQKQIALLIFSQLELQFDV